MLIFPENTAKSLSDLLRKEKEKVNVFVSENSRRDYIQRHGTDNLGRNSSSERNTKETCAFSDNTRKRRNISLSNLAEPRLSKNLIIAKT